MAQHRLGAVDVLPAVPRGATMCTGPGRRGCPLAAHRRRRRQRLAGATDGLNTGPVTKL